MATQLFLAFDDLLRDMNMDAQLPTLSALSEWGEPFGIKFNLDAMLSEKMSLGYLVEILRGFGRPLFADLKMWNGSRTMEKIVKTFVDLGVDFVNVYALADNQLAKAVKATEGSKTKILGLTVLSHYDDAYCQKWFGRKLDRSVEHFSRYAVEAGCHGIILPGTMLGVVKDLQTIKVATGVRPQWYHDDRHQQEATPTQIVQGGADWAVCGSPVFKQPGIKEKVAGLRRILDEMRQAGA